MWCCAKNHGESMSKPKSPPSKKPKQKPTLDVKKPKKLSKDELQKISGGGPGWTAGIPGIDVV
jgi:bacteriocin-like protein